MDIIDIYLRVVHILFLEQEDDVLTFTCIIAQFHEALLRIRRYCYGIQNNHLTQIRRIGRHTNAQIMLVRSSRGITTLSTRTITLEHDLVILNRLTLCYLDSRRNSICTGRGNTRCGSVCVQTQYFRTRYSTCSLVISLRCSRICHDLRTRGTYHIRNIRSCSTCGQTTYSPALRLVTGNSRIILEVTYPCSRINRITQSRELNHLPCGSFVVLA